MSSNRTVVMRLGGGKLTLTLTANFMEFGHEELNLFEEICAALEGYESLAPAPLAQRTDLEAVLKGQPAGAWVILDHDMSKVLASSDTLANAMEQAGVPRGLTGGPDCNRLVVVQVPWPGEASAPPKETR